MQVISDPDMAIEAAELASEISAAAVVLSAQSTSEICNGPCGLKCWAAQSPVANNILVVVCGPGPPSQHLAATAEEWLKRGFVVLGVLGASADPDVALPKNIRTLVALRYQLAVTEVAPEVVDIMVRGGEERRGFVSYAHADGAAHAYAVFEALARRQFDVYLDRFRTAPSSDFVERIDDELRDKAMVVVIESAQAAMSTWVHHEVMTARSRGYGLLAINIGSVPGHPRISEDRRLRLGVFDEQAIVDAVESQYRSALAAQKLRRRQSLDIALKYAVARASTVQEVEVSGDQVSLTGGPKEYAVLGSFRPAGVAEARKISEHAVRTGQRPVISCPRPTRAEARLNLGWIDNESRVAIVPDGQLLPAARLMAEGQL